LCWDEKCRKEGNALIQERSPDGEKKQKEFEDITQRLDNLTKIVETLVSVQQEREPEGNVIDIARQILSVS